MLWTRVGDRYHLGHTDHQAAGRALLAAVYPRAALPTFFPEQIAAGLEPWWVRELWLFDTNEPDYRHDIEATQDAKRAALLHHDSQNPNGMLLRSSERRAADARSNTAWCRSRSGSCRSGSRRRAIRLRLVPAVEVREQAAEAFRRRWSPHAPPASRISAPTPASAGGDVHGWISKNVATSPSRTSAGSPRKPKLSTATAAAPTRSAAADLHSGTSSGMP